MSDALLWTLTGTLFLFGIAGIVIPGLPGVGLVFAGILLYALATKFAAISPVTVVVLGAGAALALAAGYASALLGAQAGGGRRLALLGAAAGALVGAVILGPLGLVVGAWVGALAGALIEGKRTDAAVKVATLSVVGIMGGAIVQLFLALAMIVAFFLAVAR